MRLRTRTRRAALVAAATLAVVAGVVATAPASSAVTMQPRKCMVPGNFCIYSGSQSMCRWQTPVMRTTTACALIKTGRKVTLAANGTQRTVTLYPKVNFAGKPIARVAAGHTLTLHCNCQVRSYRP